MPNIYEVRKYLDRIAYSEHAGKVAEVVRKEPEKLISKQTELLKQYFTDVLFLTRPFRCSTITVQTEPTLIIKPPHEFPYLIVNPELSVGITSSYRLFSGTITANGNTQANPLGVANFLNANFYADVTAISGSWDVYLQTKDPVTGKWADVQVIFSLSQTGTYYSTVGQIGIVTDIALRWEGSGSMTCTLSAALKGGMAGAPSGVSRVIFLGDSLVTPETGLPLFEGQDKLIFPVYDVSIYAVAYTPIPIKVFTL
jgi:hypothetical protein